ncbi:MAG: DUF3810 domain-containing protein [Clostridia bacterium]|nr:DUF3810 domain-containing protein [Clostridia bacterium]
MNGNEKLQQLQTKRTIRIFLTAGIFLALTVLLYAAAAIFPRFADDVFHPVSRVLIYGLSWVTGWIPISVAEILLYIAVLGGVIALVRLIWVLVSGPRRVAFLLRFLAWVLLIAAVLVWMFCTFWGLNYQTSSIADELGLTLRRHSSEELATLNRYLTERANDLAAQVPRDAQGNVIAAPFADMAERVAIELGKVSGRKEAPAKPILASEPMSYTQITGIFVVFTAESNVNTNNVGYDLPFVIAHESAHRYGVAPENEANFFAFYLLEDAEDADLAYSVTMAALRYCQNALYAVDYDEFAEIYGTYHPLVAADMAAYSAHWKQYEGKVAEVSEAVNNTYLVVQGQSDGVRSYGRVVDLMLAWYDAEIGR